MKANWEEDVRPAESLDINAQRRRRSDSQLLQNHELAEINVLPPGVLDP